ncbi:sugar ABC transporter ATP-binding protein [Verrucomicrobia bacterium]|jgi:ABC-type sugar transport system ATPase subunit|nr:sugar ABC transporter ATP-binding protein [Verrucomicrobiota bacterium]MDA7657393.1 sugar ABC transporter ATP-binding protein [Verrucomicrobiota bacterium]
MNSDDLEAPLLKASGVRKSFGGVHALVNAGLSLHKGEVHAIMGENGAGKSTFGKILAGVLPADGGAIELDGKRFCPSSPQQAQAAGVAMIFQELDLFPHLSVAENMVAANMAFSENVFVSGRAMADFSQPHLDAVRFKSSAEALVGELSVGEQQLVAIARALSMNARIIVMDESTSALTEDAVANLFDVIRKLKDMGMAIIFVSHKLDEILQICDRVTVLRDGETVGSCTTEETDMDALVQLMVGRKVDRKLHATSHRQSEEILVCDKFSTDSVRRISFTLHRGEVLGIAGLVGSGRTEIGRALFGLDQFHLGRVTLLGQEFRPRSPREALDQGVGFVPEDRKGMGLMMNMGVRENATLSVIGRLSRSGFILKGEESQRDAMIAIQTKRKALDPEERVSHLSGGNQQKVLLGRWLLVDPEVLFLDDPTRGVDVGAKEDIYALIEKLVERGKGVIMVSSELSELLRCCDRILVMNQGEIAGTVDARVTSQEEIMHLAAGSHNEGSDL